MLEKPDRVRERNERKIREKPALMEDERLFYVLGIDGRLVWSRESENIPKPMVLEQITNWKTEQSVILSLPVPNAQSGRLLLAGAPVMDDGKFLGMVVIGKDLEQYDRTMARLAQGLGLSTFFFVLLAGLIGYFAAGRALVPIRQSFAAQRQFVADASHELRTPLSVFQISLEALYKIEKSRLGPESVDIITGLTDEVRRMSRLVGDLLTLARADAGAVEIQREQFDARTALEGAVRRLSSLAVAKKISLRWIATDELPILADRDRLVQLVYVLVDNAIKYTKPGGEVEVTMNPVTRGSQPGFQLVVKDTGIGMTEQETARIFERFFRVDKVRSRESGGFGLGLSIASWIMQAHGGSIQVKSKPGEGSVFTAFFPGR
jgi:signal transduction histidine kinase